MAASTLPAPGTKYGPCENGCDHIDCNVTRGQAGEVCRFCDKPIGYEKRFYSDEEPGRLAHADCLEDSIENERIRDGRA